MSSTEATPKLPELPDSARRVVAQLLGGEFLGASRNIRQINDLFVSITKELQTSSGDKLVETLLQTGEYLIATRGRNTPAIGNAIRLVLKDIDLNRTSSIAEIQAFMEARRADYNANSLKNAELMAEYGANLLSNCQVILPFDYSSSVMAILKRLAERGKKLDLVVPESRVLDGGRPIVKEAIAWGHSVSFVVDMAFSHFLRQTDAILIGAETIFANGDCWNTIGSYPIAVLARDYQIPFYVPTELIKIYPGSFIGLQKPIKEHNYSEILNYPASFEHPELVSVVSPDLDNVPADLITAYITPGGIVRPEHLWGETRNYLDSIGASVLLNSAAESVNTEH
jgi:ribose 1,5-bisphosphate isomerase